MVLMFRTFLEFGGLLVIWINGFHYGMVAGQTSQRDDCSKYPICKYGNVTELKQCADGSTNVTLRMVSGSGTYFTLSFRTVQEESGLNSYIGMYFMFICLFILFIYLFI